MEPARQLQSLNTLTALQFVLKCEEIKYTPNTPTSQMVSGHLHPGLDGIGPTFPAKEIDLCNQRWPGSSENACERLAILGADETSLYPGHICMGLTWFDQT